MKIYTDWANHYLEKTRHKQFIQDLQVDIADGVRLADVIEAVTNEKVPDVNRKPKTSAQMIDNINASLKFLAGLGVNVEGLVAKDIRDGNLKAILGLFFSLSRYKQQQKQVAASGGRSQTPTGGGEMLSRLPSPFRQTGRASTGKEATSSIPTPTSSLARKQVPERGRPATHASLGTGSNPLGGKASSASSSRSASPNASYSFLPQPTSVKTPAGRQQVPEKHSASRTVGSSGGSAPPGTASHRSGGGGTARSALPVGNANPSANQGKNSMLDKFKFFNSKDKTERTKSNAAGGISKRTSSSSGFSSARSERSDSSNSLSSEPKATPTPTTDGPRESSPAPSSSASGNSSPRLAVKAFAKKTFGRAINGQKDGKQQPPTQQQSKGGKEKPDGGKRHSGSPLKAATAAADETTVPASQQPTATDYTAAIEPDNPIKQSRISSLVPKDQQQSVRAAGKQTTGNSSSGGSSSRRCSSSESPVVSTPQQSQSGGGNNNNAQTMSGTTQAPPGTSIPKPTAAVKGTTKVAKDERRSIGNVPSNKDFGSKGGQSGSHVTSKSKSKPASNKTDASTSTDPPRPTATPSTPTLPQQHPSLPRNPVKGDRGRSDSTTPTGISIAMVSPMLSVKEESHHRNEEQQDVDKAKNKVSQNNNSNSSPKLISSTHSKVETTFDSDRVITRETSSEHTSKETTFSEETDDIMVNIKPMQPILRASPYSYVRNLGGGIYASSGVSSPNCRALHVSSSRLSDPPRNLGLGGRHHPLISLHTDPPRIYAAPVKRTVLDPDYHSDVESVELAAGYMSDGDVLRTGAARVDDIASGYMSEGGASLYARRIQAYPYHEGLPTLKEGVQKGPIYVHDESFDDSSSVSSGISDTIAEISTDDNLTGSSVSSDQTNPYASLKRTPKEPLPSKSHGLANGVTDRSRRNQSSDSGSFNKLPASKSSSGIRKADSAQQTDNSAFRQISSSAWRKYMQDKECSRGQSDGRLPQEKMDLLRRGKSDLDPTKTREKRSSGGSNYSSSSSGILRKSLAGSTTGISTTGQIPEKRSSGGSPKSKRKVLNKAEDNIDGKHRASIENLAAGGSDRMRLDRTSPRSSRNEPQSYSSGNGSVRTGERKVQNIRTTPAGFGYITKRPTSTCSVSSSGSAKSSSSKVSTKRSSTDKLSELGRDTSETASVGSDSSKSGFITVPITAFPRTGSSQQQPSQQQQSSGKGTLERKSKQKVCANTQTSTDLHLPTGMHSDGEYYSSRNSLGRSNKQKQYALTSPTLGLRDRVFGSRTTLNQSPLLNADISTVISNPHATLSCQDRISSRFSIPTKSQEAGDSSFYAGSLDHHGATLSNPLTCNSNSSHYSSWMRHSPSMVSSLSSAPTAPRTGSSLTEAESMESLVSTASSMPAQLQHGRTNSLTHARLLLHQRETSVSPTPRLARSNSIRSTKSEKLYPSMLQRSGEIEAFLNGTLPPSLHTLSTHKEHGRHTSQPTSPTPGNQGGRYAYPLSPVTPGVPGSGTGNSLTPYLSGLLSNTGHKEENIHGSALSLVSNSSSLYSTPEEKQAAEIRKLRRELMEAHEKVHTLTSQLSTNKQWNSQNAKNAGGRPSVVPWEIQAHVVAAFEQSLSNMTNRLQALTASAEQKVCNRSHYKKNQGYFKDSELIELRTTIENLRKRSAEAGLTTASLQTLQEHRMSRQLSTDSMSSINSLSSACSVASQTSGASQKSDISASKKKKKKGWLRSSFSKAFSRSKKNKNGSVSDVEDVRHLQSDTSAPNSPLLSGAHPMNGQGMKISQSSSAIYEKDDETAPEVVKELKKQLREKDMVLTDIRLEALSSAHQLESLKDTVNKMRSEMMNLKQDNERLQRLVSSKSLASSQSSLPMTDSLDRRLSASELSAQSSIDVLLADPSIDRDGKRVTISVFLGCHGDFEKHMNPQEGQSISEVQIGSTHVSGKTKWDLLDNLVRRIFKEYVLRVDPVSNLGLNAESVFSYHVGDVVRCKDAALPELLPCGYLVGDNMHIRITLKGTKQNSVDALAFETLIPKSIVQRYVSLLTEHRRIILCGPSGTGKTYLAHRLSEFLVLRSGKDIVPGAIATFSVDHKSAKELRQYLANVAEQCESNASDLPSVIILDNLHHVGSLGEVFNGFLNTKYQKCPYIIGTMNQATCSTTNLQLHHNFRWVLCANHMEPVKGFLGRYIRRKLFEYEVKTSVRNNDLTKIVDWMPKIWQHLNKFLETHSSSDVTIGPRLFLSCPMDVSGSQVWFTDLWNYSIVPYLLEAVREGLQLYGRRAPWEDPAEWVLENYPWSQSAPSNDWPLLLRLRPEDVGYDGHPGPGSLNSKNGHNATNEAEADPLLNMLMRLQEAASYSSPHSNDSDTTSLDSHSSSLHTEDLMGTGLESTL